MDMKRNICVIVAIFIFCGCLCGQHKSITVPAGTKISESFPPSVRYLYPEFLAGQIVLNNGISSPCMINYNMFFDDMEILQDNDTVRILRKRDMKYAIIENDTFIYVQGYMKHIHGQSLKVYCKDRIYLKDVLKVGAMGVVNRTGAISSYGSIDEMGMSYDLVVPEDHVFRREISYHIATSRGTYELFKRQNILKMFPRNKGEIRRYIRANKINFGKQEDVIKLTEFLLKL